MRHITVQRPRSRSARVAPLAALVAASLVLAVSACTSSGGSTSPTTPAAEGECTEYDTVRTSFIPAVAYATPVAADDLGILEKYCIRQELTTVSTPADGVPLLVSGGLDFHSINTGSIATAVQQGIALRIVGPTLYSGDDIAIGVPVDSPVQDLGDLEGATFGLTAPGSMVAAGWLKQFEAAGVDPASIQMTLIPPTEAIGALEKGTVAAAQLQEPFVTLAGDKIRKLTTNPWAEFGDPALGAGLVVTNDFYENNKDLVLRYQKALFETWAALAEDPDIVRDVLLANTEIDPAVIAKMNLPYMSATAELLIPTYIAGVDAMVEYGYLERPMSASEIEALFITDGS